MDTWILDLLVLFICLITSNYSSGNVQNNVQFQREIGRLLPSSSQADDDLSPADRVKRLLIYSFFYQNISFLQYQSKISFHGGN